MATTIERYVPVGETSSDAPGWHGDSTGAPITSSTQDEELALGPTCWKCKGLGVVKGKKRKRKAEGKCKNDTQQQSNSTSSGTKKTNANTIYSKKCTVCNGLGRLRPKEKTVSSTPQPKERMITRKRKCPTDWKPFGPVAHAVKMLDSLSSTNDLSIDHQISNPLYFLQQANQDSQNYDDGDESGQNKAGVIIPESFSKNKTAPSWLPIHPGEQLCNLVGTWRILQKVGSHRWTTDDIVTAHVAKQEIQKRIKTKSHMHYLDLGCGNGSVLQMTSWALMDQHTVEAFGIEARSEAVSLARRSLTFNVGPTSSSLTEEEDKTTKSKEKKNKVNVIHGDFRELEKVGHHDDLDRVKKQKFDLITGTPPYFRVDFYTTAQTDDSGSSSSGQGSKSSQTDNDNRMVTSAVIVEGGMPTAIQSAPARCEYRGGVEAYCHAASKVLSDDGIFVVCENSMNRPRVFTGAKEAGLNILRMQAVKGKSSRKECLFDVFVMEKQGPESESDSLESEMVTSDILSVRDEKGNWTIEYANLLEEMSIPARHTTA